MALYDFSRVGNLCQTTEITTGIKRLEPIVSISFFAILEKCFIRVGADAVAWNINGVAPADITVAGVACVSASDFITKMAAMLLIAGGGGGGGDITGNGVAEQVAIFDAAKNIVGYAAVTYQNNLYPSLTLGTAGKLGFAFLMRTATGEYSAIGSYQGLALQSGTQVYPIEFYIKAALVAYFSNNTGVASGESNAGVAGFHAQISSDYMGTGGLDKGAFHLERTIDSGDTGNNHHGFVDKTVFQTGSGSFNSFYAQTVIGSNRAGAEFYQGHVSGFQTRFQKVGSNRVDIMYDFNGNGALIDAGEVTKRFCFRMFDSTVAGGAVLKKQWGVYIPELAAASEDNVGAYFGSPVAIGTGFDRPHSSAMLHMESTSKGFLMPRMTGAQIEAIASVAEGLLVYCNNGNGATVNAKGFWFYDAGWHKITHV